jgi:hypothetical protein
MAENEVPLFVDELKALINKHSLERQSNTPDFILAEYMMDCLQNFNRAISARYQWYAAEHPLHSDGGTDSAKMADSQSGDNPVSTADSQPPQVS